MASDDILAQVSDLTTWFENNGGRLNPDVEIAHNAASGFHMRAKRQLHAPFDVITCPLNLSLSVLNIKPDQTWVRCVPSPLAACLDKLPLHVLTRLVLIEHLVLEEESDWYPYISLLPEVEDVVSALWSEDDCLEDTPLPQARRARRNELRKEWRQALSVMAAVGMAGTDTYKECDFDTFLWAAGILSSRSFTSSNIFPNEPSFPLLYPVLDIANHSVTTKARWICPQIANAQLFVEAPTETSHHSAAQPARTASQGPQPKDIALTLRLLDDVQAGEEVFNNYGPKANAELMLGYGFAIPDNPVDQVPLSVRLPESLINTFSEEQLPFGIQRSPLDDTGGGLRARNNLLGRYPCTIPCFQGFPPSVVFASYVTALRLRSIEEHPPKARDIPGRVVLTTLLVLYQTIQDKCVSFSKSLNHVTTLETGGNDYAHQHALTYLRGQSRICDSIRRELKGVLERLRFREAAEGQRPTVVTLTDALTSFSETLPHLYSGFTEGCQRVLGLKVEDPTELALSGQERKVWALLLVAFWHGTKSSEAENIISHWTKDLLCTHPYPSNPGSCDLVPTDWNNILSQLCRLSGTFWASIPEGDRRDVFGWAFDVVNCEVFRMPGIVDDQQVVRLCVYMRPWHEDSADEHWMFEEVEVSLDNTRPDVMVSPLRFDHDSGDDGAA
ncbi:SET domain-containing protein [Sporormia fimetaria CBS 119925]|uniref:SET domain-containing protein n=1 Tax=Sporormia fimetaria CBS 119925 TaxID=1340428 RepID=A0A6A6VJN3_9PLEO|nr:SET domain-containing protein [Sporormia fimetaria CBS 119925]